MGHGVGSPNVGSAYGTLPAANGGTGIAGGYAVGDLLYASAAGTLAKLADVAAGSVLKSGGVGVAPAWGDPAIGGDASGTLSSALVNAFVFVERLRVTAGAVQNLAFASALDGNTDGIYAVLGYIVDGSGLGPTYALEPNSLATNQYGVKTQNLDGTVTGSTHTSLWIAGVSANMMAYFNATFYARATDGTTVRTRHVSAIGHNINTAGSAMRSILSESQWNETATNVTSLRIHASQASGIGNGTEVSLWKLRNS